MYNNWKIRIIDNPIKINRDIYIFRRQGNKYQILTQEGLIEKNEGDSIDEKPIMELTPEQLQAFSDELSNVGYKPQKGFMEGKLEATEKHLEDMRKLVFKELK
jgi:hypothetical protein